MLPGTSGLVHRDPRGEKAATSVGMEGKNANKMGGGGEQQRSASLHIIWFICFANLILRPAAPASTNQTAIMNSVRKLNPAQHHRFFLCFSFVCHEICMPVCYSYMMLLFGYFGYKLTFK